MFLTVNKQPTCHKEFAGVSDLPPQCISAFETRSSSGPLAIAVKRKSKQRPKFHAAAMLFYSLQKNCPSRHCTLFDLSFHKN